MPGMRASGVIAVLLLGLFTFPREGWAPAPQGLLIRCRDGSPTAWLRYLPYGYFKHPKFHPKPEMVVGDTDDACNGICTIVLCSGSAVTPCVPGTVPGAQEFVSHVPVGTKQNVPPFGGLSNFFVRCKRGRRAVCRRLGKASPQQPLER